MSEGPAIMKYAVRKFSTEDNKNTLYPIENLQTITKIDEFVDWYSSSMKPFAYLWVFN